MTTTQSTPATVTVASTDQFMNRRTDREFVTREAADAYMATCHGYGGQAWIVSRLTTEFTRADELGVGFRFMDANRTEYTVASATLVRRHHEDVVDVVTTSGREITYAAWALVSVYVIDGRRV